MTRSATPVVLALAVAALAGCSSGGATTSTTTTARTSTTTPTGTASDTASPAMSMPMGTSGTAAATSGGASSTDASTSGAMGTGHQMDGGPAPAGMTPAAHPRYPVGSRVRLTADHMAGMAGAPAKVDGVYDTVAYEISYTPTTGGARVTHHRWVVQQELRGVGPRRLPDGATAVVEADHMPGMRGATATIDASTTQPVYMVDYQADGMTMTRHKWVVQSEVAPAS